jgi:hypothetical protein
LISIRWRSEVVKRAALRPQSFGFVGSSPTVIILEFFFLVFVCNVKKNYVTPFFFFFFFFLLFWFDKRRILHRYSASSVDFSSTQIEEHSTTVIRKVCMYEKIISFKCQNLLFYNGLHKWDGKIKRVVKRVLSNYLKKIDICPKIDGVPKKDS